MNVRCTSPLDDVVIEELWQKLVEQDARWKQSRVLGPGKGVVFPKRILRRDRGGRAAAPGRVRA